MVQQTIRTAQLSAEEICRLGQAIYDRDLKDKLELAHNGKVVVINVANGDYFVAADERQALDAARAKYPDEVFFMDRIGSPAALRLGAARRQ